MFSSSQWNSVVLAFILEMRREMISSSIYYFKNFMSIYGTPDTKCTMSSLSASIAAFHLFFETICVMFASPMFFTFNFCLHFS